MRFVHIADMHFDMQFKMLSDKIGIGEQRRYDQRVILRKIINYIKENNIKVGISIKPQTDVKELYDLLPYVHTVLIMTVEPGKGGQTLIPDTIKKINKLNEYRQQKNLDFDIEADGGINSENIEEIRKAGCDIVVAGTYIVNSENFKEAINSLK